MSWCTFCRPRAPEGGGRLQPPTRIYLVYARKCRTTRERLASDTSCALAYCKVDAEAAWRYTASEATSPMDPADHVIVAATWTGAYSPRCGIADVPRYRLDWSDTVDPQSFGGAT